MAELIKKHRKLAAKTHMSTKVTKSLCEAQEARGVAKNAVLGAEVGAETRWSGYQHSLADGTTSWRLTSRSLVGMSSVVVVGGRRRSSVVGTTSLELDVLGPVGRRHRSSSSVDDHGG